MSKTKTIDQEIEEIEILRATVTDPCDIHTANMRIVRLREERENLLQLITCGTCSIQGDCKGLEHLSNQVRVAKERLGGY